MGIDPAITDLHKVKCGIDNIMCGTLLPRLQLLIFKWIKVSLILIALPHPTVLYNCEFMFLLYSLILVKENQFG